MKKKLYVVIEKQLQDVGGIEETTGHKTITVYDIQKNELKEILEIKGFNEDSTLDLIGVHQEDGGFDIDKVELVFL